MNTFEGVASFVEAAVFLVVVGYAALKAHRTERQTRATGNGWAELVTTRLGSIEQGQNRIETKIDAHIQSHADAHISSGVPASTSLGSASLGSVELLDPDRTD
jgi:hypothetical protein